MRFKHSFSVLLSPIIFLALSWGKFYSTQSFMVDDNFFRSEMGIFLSLILGWVGIIAGYYAFWKIFHSDSVMLNFKALSYAIAVISFFTLPLYSSDIFSILSLGTEEVFNSRPYLHYFLSQDNIYYEYVYKIYHNIPCVYGPLNIWVAKFLNISTTEVWINLLATKLVFLVFHILFIELANKWLQNTDSTIFHRRWIVCLPLFPLVWFQGFMQLHNDVFCFMLILSASYLLFVKHKKLLFFILLSMAFTVKFTFALFYLLYFYYLFCKNEKVESLKLALYFIVSLSCIALIYYPIISDWREILAPIKVLSTLGTHGSLKDAVFAIFNSKKLFVLIDGIVLLFLVLFLFYHARRKEHTFIVHGLISFSFIFLCFYSHRLFPWYLFMPLLFFIFQIKEKIFWTRWILFIGVAYSLQDLSVQIPHKTLLYNINVAITTALGFVAIFLFIRKRLF